LRAVSAYYGVWQSSGCKAQVTIERISNAIDARRAKWPACGVAAAKRCVLQSSLPCSGPHMNRKFLTHLGPAEGRRSQPDVQVVDQDSNPIVFFSILRGQKHDAFVAIGGITVNSALSFSPLPRIARQPFNES
jgi:hypothetical protein